MNSILVIVLTRVSSTIQLNLAKEMVYKLLGLGGIAGISKLVATICGGIPKERQMAMYRIEYLRAIVRQVVDKTHAMSKPLLGLFQPRAIVSAYAQGARAHMRGGRLRSQCRALLLPTSRPPLVCKDIGWFDCNNPETLASTFGEALAFIEGGLGPSGMNLICYDLGQICSGLALAVYVLPIIAAVATSIFPVIFYAVWLSNHATVTSTRKISVAYSKAGGVASEALGAIRTIASLGIEDQMAHRYTDRLSEAMREGIKKLLQLNSATGILLGACPMMMSMCLVVGALLVRDGRVDSEWEYSCNRDPISEECTSSFPANFDDWESLPTSFCVGRDSCNAYDPSFYLGNMNFSNSSSPAPYHLPLVNGVPVGALTRERCLDHGMQNLKLTCFSTCMLKDDTRRSYFLTPSNSSTWFDAFLANVMPGGAEAAITLDECSISVSSAFVSALCVYYAVLAFGVLPQCLASIQKARQACAPIKLMLNRVPPIDSFSDEGTKPPALKGDIVVKDVVFAYPLAPAFNICRGYSLSIKAGQLCALSGPSGSGKSTIIGLIERFYDPQSGSILLDGHDITTLNLRWLRSKIALVGQEPVLFSGTVYDAIAYGVHGECTKAQVEAAARIADAYNFITTVLADGWDTEVGQGGCKLSGGQKQRVAIARAMIKEPELVLLDEATSALDNQAEKAVQSALDAIRERKKKTTITVAHRLSTIRHADLICVVNKGVIVEKGTWEELLAMQDGIFNALAAKQEAASAADRQWMAEAEAEASRRAHHESIREGLPEAVKLPGTLGGAKGLAMMRKAVHAVQIQVQVAKAFHEESHTKQLQLALKAASGGPVADARGSAASSIGAPPIGVLAAMKTRGKEHEKRESEGGEDNVPKGAGLNVLKKLKTFESAGDDTLLKMGCLASFFSGGLIPAGALMVSEMLVAYTRVDPDQVFDECLKYGTLLFIFSVLQMLFGTVEGLCFGTYGERMTLNLRSALMRVLLNQEIGYFDFEQNNAGELSQFLGEKVALVQTLVGEKQQLLVRLLMSFGMTVFITFYFGHWLMALVSLAFVPFLMVCFAIQLSAVGLKVEAPSTEDEEVRNTTARGEKGRNKKTGKVVAKSAGQLLGELVKGMKTVSSFNAEEPFLAAYQRDVLAKTRANTSKLWLQGLAIAFVQIVLLSQSGIQIMIGLYLQNGKYLTEPEVKVYPHADCLIDMQYLKDLLVPIMVVQFLLAPLGMMSSQLSDAKTAL